MKNKNLFLLSGILAFYALVILPACNKKFDEPPGATSHLSELGYVGNSNIKTLKTYVGNIDGGFTQITDSIIITGVVSANDKSGNVYKELYIQDSSGGMSIMLDATGLYNTFPVGREVAVECKGLWLVNTKGMKKICQREIVNGTASAIGIPSAAISNYLHVGAIGQPVNIKTVSISQLTSSNTSLLGSLVMISNVEVVSGDLRKTWSDISPAKIDQNITIRTCSDTSIIIRTSAYANFAGVKVPQGNGSVIAVFTTYITTPQLLIRDTTDAPLISTRCDGSQPGALDTLKTIEYIRSLGLNAPVPSHTLIEGVITSNASNEGVGNFIIQDGSGYAIQIHFSPNRPYSYNEKVNLDVSGALVSRYTPSGGTPGALQLTNVGYGISLGAGSIPPRVTTVADVLANYTTWESTEVKLNNVTIVQGSSNSTGVNYTITDATGTITTFIRNSLGLTLPASASSITGYIGIFGGGPQLTLRVASDVQ